MHSKKMTIIGLVLLILLFSISCKKEIQSSEKAEISYPTEIPNLIGKWKSENSEAIVYGKLEHREATTDHEFTSMSFTIEIDEQKGRVFFGIRYSTRHSENIVGYIGLDNKTIYFTDHDGYFQGQVNNDGSLTIGYLEAGEESRIASIATYKKG